MDQIIPLTSAPQQTFAVQLQIDGGSISLNLELNWSEMAGYWVLSIFDATGNLLLDSIPLITGWYPAANILAQFAYLGIGSAFVINDGNSTSDYPGRNDLGTAFGLLWSDTPVLEAAA